jgi:hypothetical protein
MVAARGVCAPSRDIGFIIFPGPFAFFNSFARGVCYLDVMFPITLSP